MKLLPFIAVLVLGTSFYCFGLPNNSNNDSPVLQAPSYHDTMPQLNKDIAAFVKAHLNKQVGRGECWDLAATPLELLGAKWDKQYQYGRAVDYKTDTIYPGDMIQFENVEVKYKIGNGTRTEFMTHHTAVVYKVTDKGKFVIAQQNSNDYGRKVSLLNLDLNDITKGTFTIYRPEK